MDELDLLEKFGLPSAGELTEGLIRIMKKHTEENATIKTFDLALKLNAEFNPAQKHEATIILALIAQATLLNQAFVMMPRQGMVMPNGPTD